MFSPGVDPQLSTVSPFPSVLTQGGNAVNLDGLWTHLAQADDARLVEITQQAQEFLNQEHGNAAAGTLGHHTLTLVQDNGEIAPLQWKLVAERVLGTGQKILQKREEQQHAQPLVDEQRFIDRIAKKIFENRFRLLELKIFNIGITSFKYDLKNLASSLKYGGEELDQEHRAFEQLSLDFKRVRSSWKSAQQERHTDVEKTLNDLKGRASRLKERISQARQEGKARKAAEAAPKPILHIEPVVVASHTPVAKQEAEPVQQKMAPTWREAAAERKLRREQADQEIKEEIEAKKVREKEQRKAKGLPSLSKIMKARRTGVALKGPYSKELWKTVCSDLESLMGAVPKIESDEWLKNLHTLCFSPKPVAKVETPIKVKALSSVLSPRTIAFPTKPLLPERVKIVHISDTSLSKRVTRLFKRLIVSLKELVMTLGRHMSFSVRATPTEEKRFLQWALASKRRIEAPAG